MRRRGEGFVWIGLHEPCDEQIKDIAEVFELHELAVEDAVQAQRPKLERYDDMLIMVLKTVCYVGQAQPTTANEIVEDQRWRGSSSRGTRRHRPATTRSTCDVRLRLEADPEQLELEAAAVLHAIADQVVDTLHLEVVEPSRPHRRDGPQVFTPRSTMDAEQIYVMKREVLDLRRAVVRSWRRC